LVPVEFHLYPNFPNPFNPETTIRYGVPQKGHVKLSVFNILGQQIRILVEKNQLPGYYEVIWDGCDGMGNRVASGVYIYRLEACAKIATRKMVVLK
jgi:hypothetical protein